MAARALTAARRRRLIAGGALVRPLRASDVEPMRARTAPPFSGTGWIFEVKYDGFRMIAGKEGGRPRLRLRRRGTEVTERFPEVAAAVAALPGDDLVLDGELVALDGAGRPDFQRLQNRVSPLRLFAFDLLAVDGLDLRRVPLRERKEALRDVLEGTDVGYVTHVEDTGEALYGEARALGLEGLVAKRALSPYAAGENGDWRKLPVLQTGEFVVVGFTKVEAGREGGLHLAARAGPGPGLRYVGRVGSGFTEGTLGAARELLGFRTVPAPPCLGAAPRGRGHTWVEPLVVCEVRFLEQTDGGLLRHPVFVRFLPHKAPGR